MYNDSSVVARTLKYFKGVWYLYIPSLLVYSSQSFLMMGYTAFVQYNTVSAVMSGDVRALPHLIAVSVAAYVSLLLVIGLGMSVFDYVSIRVQNTVKKSMVANVFDDGWSYDDPLLAKDEILARALSDSPKTVSLFTHILGSFLTPIFVVLGSVIVLFSLNWQLGLIILGQFALITAFGLAVKPRVRLLGDRMQQSQGEYIKKLGSILSGMQTIKAMNMEKRQSDESSHIISAFRNLSIKRAYLDAFRSLFGSVLHGVCFLSALLIGFTLYQRGGLSISSFTLIPLLMGYVYGSANDIVIAWWDSQHSLVAIQRVFEVIDASENAREKRKSIGKAQQSLHFEDEAAPMPWLTVKNASLLYENQHGLSPISFTLSKGDLLYVKGAVGTGKSTLFKIILGLVRKSQGEIVVDGMNQDFVETQKWLQTFSYVEQSPKLFHMTLKENILMGYPVDSDRLQAVLAMTGLDEIAGKHEKGLMENIGGKDGVQLSGGELQLLCFARALYSPAPIVLLDEFSSAMDTKTEEMVKDILKIMQDSGSKFFKTALVISHNSCYAELSDKVISTDVIY